MKVRLLTGPVCALLLCAPLAYSQSSEAKANNNQAAQAAPASTDAATAEAKRQGTVALKPAEHSPSQTMSQAIAFERYKELSAQREARKEGTSSAARNAEEPKGAVQKKQK